jgi:hypothetical protein
MPATLVSGGTYLFEIDTGFGDGFTLDDTQQGILNGTEFVLDGVDSYSDISAQVQTARIFRGRRTDLESIQPGTLVINAIDPQRNFDPYNEDSIYFDEFDDTPGLSPLREVRVSRNGEYLYKGRVVDFAYSYGSRPGELPRVVITCADDLFLLANTRLSAFTPSAELSSDRVTTILDRTEVAYPAGTRDIDTGTTTLGAYPIAEGTSTLEYLRKIQAAEQGRVYISRDGDLAFDARIGSTLSSPAVVFSDVAGSGDTPYRGLAIDYSTEDVINRAVVQRTGGTAQTEEDLASQALYQIQAFTITDSLLSTDAQALALAEYLLAPIPEPRFSSLVVDLYPLTTGDKDDVAELEIGDTVEITKSYDSGSPATVTEELAVEGIEHLISTQGHTVTLYTAPTTVVYALLLDDPVFGILDADNVLT